MTGDEPPHRATSQPPHEPARQAAQTGGIGRVGARIANAVTDSRGPVHQLTAETMHVAFAAAEVPPTRSPRLIAEAMLRELAGRFVAPSSFPRLRAQLRTRGMVLVAGADGSGRRTAALMVLHSAGEGTFRELPDEGVDPAAVELDLEAIEPGDRLLLDLSELPEQLPRLRRTLVDYYSAVVRRGAYCAVVLPEHAEHELAAELHPMIGRIERPDGRAVLRRHLAAIGITEPIADAAVPGLTAHLESDPMRELARLALLTGETREAADGAGTADQWLAQAIEALSVALDAVAKWIRNNQDGRLRALLLTTAMFERLPAEVVDQATDTLLSTVQFPDDDTHLLERRDLTECLKLIDARLDGELRVRFDTITYGGMVRAHFWNGFPGMRLKLRGWLDTALRLDSVDDRGRAAVLRRFAEQCWRTRNLDDLFWLVERWGQDRSQRAPRLVATAATALADGLTDTRHGGAFRRKVYDWSYTRNLAPNLAMQLVRLCAESIAPTHPDQALVRLRHLTRNEDPAVSAAARRTLIALCADDDRFLRRVLHRLADDLSQPRPRTTDLDLFAAVADPLRVTVPGIRDQLVAGWYGLMASRPHVSWTEPVRRWLDAHAAGASDRVLDVLVAAVTGHSDLLARLYLVTREWAAEDRTRRRTAAELIRRSDRANGLDLPTDRWANTTEGVVR